MPPNTSSINRNVRRSTREVGRIRVFGSSSDCYTRTTAVSRDNNTVGFRRVKPGHLYTHRQRWHSVRQSCSTTSRGDVCTVGPFATGVRESRDNSGIRNTGEAFFDSRDFLFGLDESFSCNPFTWSITLTGSAPALCRLPCRSRHFNTPMTE